MDRTVDVTHFERVSAARVQNDCVLIGLHLIERIEINQTRGAVLGDLSSQAEETVIVDLAFLCLCHQPTANERCKRNQAENCISFDTHGANPFRIPPHTTRTGLPRIKAGMGNLNEFTKAIQARGCAAECTSLKRVASTPVYTCVVDSDACPSSVWIARRSAPAASRCVAKA